MTITAKLEELVKHAQEFIDYVNEPPDGSGQYVVIAMYQNDGLLLSYRELRASAPARRRYADWWNKRQGDK